ncbi:MAG: ROK family protein [Lentisphaeria bacterium]|nr:MAG: ROK family protein [Lentisphaeria bacterium]
MHHQRGLLQTGYSCVDPFFLGAVSNGISSLVARGILISASEHFHRSKCFCFNHKRHLLMGAEIRRHSIIYLLLTLGGKILTRYEHPLSFDRFDGRKLQHDLYQGVERTLELAELGWDTLDALAVSLYGAVDESTLMWHQSPLFPEFRDYDFSTVRSDYSGLKYFRIGHDIYDKALSVLFQNQWNFSDILFIHIASGIGSAYWHNGEFIRGSRGFAGELGHIPCNLRPTDCETLCPCGQKNCLETFCSLDGASRFIRGTLHKKSFYSLSAVENKKLYEYLEPYLLQLALTAVNTFDPFALVIGGELLEPFLEEMNSRFVTRLRDSSWQRSPEKFVTYSIRQCNCALGAALDIRNHIIDILAHDENM